MLIDFWVTFLRKNVKFFGEKIIGYSGPAAKSDRV